MRPIRSIWFSLYWVIFLAAFTTVYASYDGRWLGTLMLNLVRLPFMIGVAYLCFHRHFNIPHVSMSVRIGLTLLLIICAALLSRLIFGLFVFPAYFQSDYSFHFWNVSALFNQFLVITAGIAGYGTLKYLSEKAVWKNRQEKLIEEKRTAELNFYRAQVHPHFLFNTLNGIYAESLKPHGQTADLILKLSDLLRFMLYECNQNAIPLQTEIKVITDYIALEKLRYGERLKIDFTFDEKLDKNVLIPPLIFLGLVENAFKHGVSAQPENSFILIELSCCKEELILTVCNTDYADQKDNMGSQRGIGLENIRRQLQLLYRDDFSLNQERDKGIFKTELQIPIREEIGLHSH